MFEGHVELAHVVFVKLYSDNVLFVVSACCN